MRRLALFVLLAVWSAVGTAFAADIPLTASSWAPFAGTGTLGNAVDTVPGLGSTTVLTSATAQGTGFGFVQTNYSSRSYNARYVRAQVKSGGPFILYVRARGSNGQDYYLSYYSATVVSGAGTGNYLNFTLSGEYPGRYNQYATFVMDVGADLARLVPGVTLSWIRWFAVRGPMSLGRLEVLTTLDYLAGDDDGDLLTGAAEDALGTSPFLFDTDGDGLADGLEAANPCANPLSAAVPGSVDSDPDLDGIPTRTEIYLGSNCNAANGATIPTSYGWVPYAPSAVLPPGASFSVGGDGALTLTHTELDPFGVGLRFPDPTGKLRLPNYLQAGTDKFAFSVMSAEHFWVFVRVKASNGSSYYLQYTAGTEAPSFGNGYAVYQLGALGYTFSGSSYTTVQRNLSADLSMFVPGVTVQKILFVTMRGRMSLKDMTFIDQSPPRINNPQALPALAGKNQLVTVTFMLDEGVSATPTVTLGGNAMTLATTDGFNYTYEYTTTGLETNGTNTVAISATDRSGNTANRDISVELDVTEPFLADGIGTSDDYLHAGETLYIDVLPSEVPATGSYLQVAGRDATFLFESGGRYYLSYDVLGDEGEGTSSIDVQIVDLAGNTSPAYSRPVTFDFTPPTASPLWVSKDPARAGDAVSVYFTLDQAVTAPPTVTIGGLPATYVTSVGLSFQYRRTLTGSEIGGTLTEVEVVAFDRAGNAGGGLIYMETDFVAPSFSDLAPAFPLGTTGSVIDISFDASEDLAFNPTVTIGGNSASYMDRVGTTYYYRYWVGGWEPQGANAIVASGGDPAGNLGFTMLGALVLDYKPPAITGVSMSPLMGRAGDTVTIGFSLGETVPVQPTVDFDGLAATLVSQVGNTYSFTYTLTGAENNGNVQVVIRARDAAGNVGQRTLFFMVDAPPFVSLTVPADGAAGVTVTTKIRVQFNENMNGATINGTTFTVTGGPAVGGVSYDAGTRVATFQLSGINQLAYDTQYTVTLTTGITDAGGNPLAAPHVFQFRTAVMGMLSISGALQTPPAWVNPAVIEVTGNHLGTVSAGTYQIDVDKRADNFVYAWDDVNGDKVWQAGAEERLIAWNCNIYPGTDLWSTLTGNVTNANIAYRRVSGNLAAPAVWNAKVMETVTGNQAAIAGGAYVLNADAGDDRHLVVYDDANANGQRDPGENGITHAYDPLSFCGGMLPPLNFGIRQISGRVTEPTAPFLDLIAASQDPDGPYTYAPIVGANRDYTVFANVNYGVYVFAFDDANGNGLLDKNEVRIPVSANPVNLTMGDVTGAYIFRRRITGNVPPAPASWKHSRVTMQGDGYAADAPAAGGAYGVWVPARPQLTLTWFDDANDNYRFDSGETSVRYVYPLTTLYSDLANINFTTVCSIAGSFTVPAYWSPGYVFVHAAATTYGTAATGPVAGSSYTTPAQPGTAAMRLTAFEDTDRNGRFETGRDRHVAYETNDFSNTANCFMTGRNFLVSRLIAGSITLVQPGWNSRVMVQSTQTYDQAMNTVAAAASYNVRTAASTYNYVYLFNDKNGNLVLDTGEPYLQHASTFNTVSGGQIANFYGRTISGTAIAPIDAVNPKVGVAQNVATATGAGGAYSLAVNDKYHYVQFWDDVDNDDTLDWGLESVYAWAGTNTTAGNVRLNFNLHSIAGRVNVPPSWTTPRISIDWSQTFNIAPDGKYVAYVADGSHQVVAFDDLNANGQFEWQEPAVTYPNTVIVNGFDVTGINIDYPTLSGTVDVPPTYTNPLVGTIFGGTTAKPVAPVGGTFSLPAAFGWLQVGLFDDLNYNGAYDWSEPVIRLPGGGINVTGDMSGLVITYRTISGAVDFPPAWTRPGVYANAGGSTVEGVVDGFGNYEVYVGAEMWVTVGMYDDVALQGMYTWADPTINYVTGIDTQSGDVSGIDLFYRIVSGTLEPGLTAGWIRPRIVTSGGTSITQDLTGTAFTLYVDPYTGPYALAVYDDFSLNGYKDTYEPGRVYAAPGCPTSIDVSLADATGLYIDSSCPF